MHIPRDRTLCLQAIFGDYLGSELAKHSDPELRCIVKEDTHSAATDLGPSNRRRLAGVIGVCCLRVAPWTEPPFLRTDADVFAHMFARTRDGREHRVWVLCLDADHALQEEVLAYFGGDTESPPPVRLLLRHAIRTAAAEIYVVETPGTWRPRVDRKTCATLTELRDVGERIGIAVRGWLVIARDGAIWVNDDAATDADVSETLAA